MDQRERVEHAILHQPVDRIPFDFFDEAGFLFRNGMYDPSLRLALSLREQVEARLKFHETFKTDLIFDAPVIGRGRTGYHALLPERYSGRYTLGSAFFPLTACLWLPYSPWIKGLQPGDPGLEEQIEFEIHWDNGLHRTLFAETAGGTISGYDRLMASRDEYPLWKEVFEPDVKGFDYTYTGFLKEKTGGNTVLYGTIGCPFSMTAILAGIETAATLFLDDPDFADECMSFFTEAIIEAGRDMIRHGIDVLRIGGAWTSLLGPGMYSEFVAPYHRRIASALRSSGGYTFLHCCGHINNMLEAYAAAGWDGLEPLTPAPLGNVDLEDAKKRIGDEICLKGNINPVHVLKEGTPGQVEEAASACLDAGSPGSGFIFSVADCMAAGTPLGNIERLAEIVHGYVPGQSISR